MYEKIDGETLSIEVEDDKLTITVGGTDQFIEIRWDDQYDELSQLLLQAEMLGPE